MSRVTPAPESLPAASALPLEPKVVPPEGGTPLNVMGNHIRLLLTGADTGGQFTLVEEYDQPGCGIPLHIHQHEDEVFQVFEGQVKCRVGDQTIIAGPGTTVYAPKGLPHGYQIVGDGPARLQVAIFPAGIEHMFVELSQLPAGDPPNLDRVVEISGRYDIRLLP